MYKAAKEKHQQITLYPNEDYDESVNNGNCVQYEAAGGNKNDYLTMFEDFIEKENGLSNWDEDNQDELMEDVIDNVTESCDEDVDENEKE